MNVIKFIKVCFEKLIIINKNTQKNSVDISGHVIHLIQYLIFVKYL